jgi:hypothetical protein
MPGRKSRCRSSRRLTGATNGMKPRILHRTAGWAATGTGSLRLDPGPAAACRPLQARPPASFPQPAPERRSCSTLPASGRGRWRAAKRRRWAPSRRMPRLLSVLPWGNCAPNRAIRIVQAEDASPAAKSAPGASTPFGSCTVAKALFEEQQSNVCVVSTGAASTQPGSQHGSQLQGPCGTWCLRQTLAAARCLALGLRCRTSPAPAGPCLQESRTPNRAGRLCHRLRLRRRAAAPFTPTHPTPAPPCRSPAAPLGRTGTRRRAGPLQGRRQQPRRRAAGLARGQLPFHPQHRRHPERDRARAQPRQGRRAAAAAAAAGALPAASSRRLWRRRQPAAAPAASGPGASAADALAVAHPGAAALCRRRGLLQQQPGAQHTRRAPAGRRRQRRQQQQQQHPGGWQQPGPAQHRGRLQRAGLPIRRAARRRPAQPPPPPRPHGAQPLGVAPAGELPPAQLLLGLRV